MLTYEITKPPYSFYSFALFYERGDIFDCLRSLQLVSSRDVRLFVRHNPRSAEKFVCEITNSEVAMKLNRNNNESEG